MHLEYLDIPECPIRGDLIQEVTNPLYMGKIITFVVSTMTIFIISAHFNLYNDPPV